MWIKAGKKHLHSILHTNCKIVTISNCVFCHALIYMILYGLVLVLWDAFQWNVHTQTHTKWKLSKTIPRFTSYISNVLSTDELIFVCEL